MPSKIIGTFSASGGDCTIDFSLDISYANGVATVQFSGDVGEAPTTPASESETVTSGPKDCDESNCQVEVQPKTGETWMSVNEVGDFDVTVVQA